MSVPPRWLLLGLTGVVNLLAKVRRRLLPRHVAAIELGTMSWVAQALAAFCDLGLPQALAREPKTAAELSAQGYGRADKLFRLLRALAAYDVVRYAGGDRFTLGHLGKGLVGERSASPMVLYANAPWHLQGYSKLAQSIRGTSSGFETAHGAPLFAYFQQNAQAGAVFDAAMQSLTPLFAHAFAHAYDFSKLSHVVDIGGGTGVLLALVLERYPAMRGTVFELPAVARRAREIARTDEMGERLQIAEGNIFADAPPAADAYIFSHVLHDWDDESCIRMLQNVRRAMPPNGRVLVYEVVAARPNNAWSQDRLQDIEMLAILPGRERTREEYGSLFSRSGLRLNRVIPASAPESIIEGVLDD